MVRLCHGPGFRPNKEFLVIFFSPIRDPYHTNTAATHFNGAMHTTIYKIWWCAYFFPLQNTALDDVGPSFPLKVLYCGPQYGLELCTILWADIYTQSVFQPDYILSGNAL